MPFTRKLVNRLTMPTKHVVVCEDDLNAQRLISSHLHDILGCQGHVQVSFVPGAEMAAAIIERGIPVDLVLLDHDMPYGDGSEFLTWLKVMGLLDQIKVITFSGIRYNNERMLSNGAHVYFMKDEVIGGLGDTLILEHLK